ncbi:MAG: glycosyltransferase, partial [Gemmatimonadales bacterium]
MHVVLFHHARIPPARYGGTERVVAWLAAGLAELGHEVTLLAGKGSRVAGVHVVEVNAADVLSPRFDLKRFVASQVDLMHYHVPVKHPPKGVPWLWTLHGNMRNGTPPAQTICLSADHARRHGVQAFVHNGLKLDEYEFRATKDDFDLFLARLHSVKGWQLAVQATRRCRVKLCVAGGWRPTFSRYLKFVGEVGGDEKRTLLAGAQCLWAPVQWDEPFGLNVIEAFASGTPVIGCPRGALPELFVPSVGGLGQSLDDLVALRRRIGEWKPEECRAHAERRFSHIRMARDYVRMYEG